MTKIKLFSSIAGLPVRLRIATGDDVIANDQINPGDIIVELVDTNQSIAVIPHDRFYDLNGNWFAFD